MRKIFIAVIALIFITTLATAQKQHYTIAVGAFIDAKPQDFKELKPLGFVYSFHQPKSNVTQVYLGGFNDMATAEKALQILKNKGFDNALIQERKLDTGEIVTVIQMATRDTRKSIKWEKFDKVGDLLGIVSGNNIKILTGPFDDLAAAKTKLKGIKKKGFDDAFIKKVNSALLISLDEFETGIKKPFINLNSDLAEQPIKPSKKNTDKPKSYDNSGVQAKGGAAPKAVKKNTIKIAPPSINGKLKRHFAIELQKVLKKEGYYKSTIDGYYGKGTASSYRKARKENDLLNKYAGLVDKIPTEPTGEEIDKLQESINHLWDNKRAYDIVEANVAPVALAYQAVYLFEKEGPSSKVNRAMSKALRRGFEGKKLENQPPIDYSSTYAYEDAGQLILHLFYVHSAPGNEYYVPCWVADKFPKETARAKKKMAKFNSKYFKMAACEQFDLGWDELNILQAMAYAMKGSGAVNYTSLSMDVSARKELITSPSKLSKGEIGELLDWEKELMSSLDAWANRKPKYKDTVTAFKIAFYQSAVRLEDYFMNKSFSRTQAKGLALATINSYIGTYLERFL